MNALAPVTPLGVFNALGSPALSPSLEPGTISVTCALPDKATPAASSPAGFVSLINLMLVPAGRDLSDEPLETPITRSPQLIANALIRSMLDRAMPDRTTPDLPAAGTLATAVKALAGTPARKERSAANLIERTPVERMPVETQPVLAAPPESPEVAISPAAPVKAVTAPVPGIAAASAIPIRDDNPHNAPQPARGESVTPAVKPELAFGLRLTPIGAPESDGPQSDVSATPLPDPVPPSNPPAQSSNITPQSIQDLVPTVVAEVTMQAPESAAKPTTPTEATPKPPRESPATPAGTNTRQATQPGQSATPSVTRVSEIASVADHTNPFASGFEPMPMSAPNPTLAEHAPQTAAEVLRASEPAVPVETAAPTVSAQTIAVRIALPDVPAVDVHVMERAGQVQVAVRTPDTGLQTSLRQDLGTLVNSLERSGFHAEAFTPRDSLPSAGASSQMNFQSNGRQQDSGEHASGNPGEGNHHGRQGSQQQPGQQSGQHAGQQGRRGRRSQTWIETMEAAA